MTSTTVQTDLPFSLEPVSYADIPALTRISAEAFRFDRHTQIKQLGRAGYDMDGVTLAGLQHGLGSEKYVYVKAVVHGETAGWVGWMVHGVADWREKAMAQVPLLERWRQPEPQPKASEPSADDTKAEPDEPEHEQDSIARLCALEAADMQRMQTILMPPGARCVVLIGLNVAPAHQRRGAGSALLRFGCDVADALGVFSWAHASEAAWPALRKLAFEVVSELDLDLDAWAPRPPAEGEVEGSTVRGRYVLRYCKRLPKT